MALSKVDYNSLNVTAAASKALKWNSGADGFETGDVAGSMVLIKTLTASSSATLDFVDGTSDVDLDNTYPIYLFKFINIHPSGSGTFRFNGSSDTGSNYNVTKTNTAFYASNRESVGTQSGLSYNADEDLAQSTDFCDLTYASQIGTDNDNCGDGELWLFNPSSTTFVKHFISRTSQNYRVGNPAEIDWFVAGYCNTTTAIDGVQFKMNDGNIDSGDICLYGLTT